MNKGTNPGYTLIKKVIDSMNGELAELEEDLKMWHNNPPEHHKQVEKIKNILKERELIKISLHTYVNEIIPEDFRQGGENGSGRDPHAEA